MLTAGVLALFCRCCRRPGTLKWGWFLARGKPGQPGTAGQAMTTAHLQGGLTVRVTVPGAVSWMRPPGGGLFRGVVLGA